MKQFRLLFWVFFGDFFYKVSLDVKKKKKNSVAASNKSVDCPFDKSITEYVRMFRRSNTNVQFQHMLFKPNTKQMRKLSINLMFIPNK